MLWAAICAASGPLKAAPCDGLFDLLAAWTGRLKILRRVAFHSGAPLLPSLDFVAEIAKPVGQFGLVDGGGKLLAIEESLRLQGAGGAIFALGHIEDHGVGMELGSGVAIDRTGGVMLELCRNEFAGGFGGIGCRRSAPACTAPTP